MWKASPIVCLLIALACLAPVRCVKELAGAGHLARFLNHPRVVSVVGFFDRDKRKLSRNVMNQVLTLLAEDIELMTYDMSFYIVPFDTRVLGADNTPASYTRLVYYIGHYPHHFGDFDELSLGLKTGKSTLEEVVAKSKKWILSKVKKLHARVNTLQEFKLKLDKHHVMAAFLGFKRQGLESGMFDLAHKHPGYPIYRVQNRTLAAELYKDYTSKDLGDQEMFCVFRATKSLTEFDHHHIHCMKAQPYPTKYDHFLVTHMNHKLHHYNHGASHLIHRHAHHRHLLFAYMYDENSDPTLREEFTAAVKKLPKQFAYTLVELHNELESSNFALVFGRSPDAFEAGKVYRFYHEGNYVYHDMMDTPVTRDNIIKFAFELHRRRYHSNDEHVKDALDTHFDGLQNEMGQL